MDRKYGWHRDCPDFRDQFYKLVVGDISALPKNIDLRPTCSEVEDQQALGSCTANALVGNLEFLNKKNGLTQLDLSRLFVYFNERLIEGTVNSDSGAMIRDGIKALARWGICYEASWPYVISDFAQTPPHDCYASAIKHPISLYQRIDSQVDRLACLASGFPFVFGFTVYSGFESEEVARTGMLQMPTHSESCLGGHAVMACGYDMLAQKFLVRNSWGKSWGLGGYFWMPFRYMDTLTADCWTIRG